MSRGELAAGSVPLAPTALRAAQVAALLDRRDAALAAGDRAEEGAGLPVLAATVGGTRMLLPMARIAGVIRLPAVARVPHAPPACLGIFSHGGAIATLLDPAHALGGTGEAAQTPAHAVVLRGAGPVLALAVDAAEGRLVAGAPEEDGDPAALTVLAPLRDGRHAALVDIDRLVSQLLGA